MVKRKQIIYSIALALLGIALIIFLVTLLNRKEDAGGTIGQEQLRYQAGLYSSDICLNDFALHLELAVDRDCIKSIRITNIDEAVVAMYPLVEPSLKSLSEQLINGIDIDSVTVSEDSKFTQMLLIDTIRSTLAKATLD